MKRINKRTVWGFVCSLALTLFVACTEEPVETTGSIYGIVNDATNGTPVSMAHVLLNPGGKATNTGGDGRYEFLMAATCATFTCCRAIHYPDIQSRLYYQYETDHSCGRTTSVGRHVIDNGTKGGGYFDKSCKLELWYDSGRTVGNVD